MPRRGKDFYRGISFQPPAAVAAAARRALERRAQQPPSKRGMTPVGLARARQLLHRQELSPTTIDRMVSYFGTPEKGFLPGTVNLPPRPGITDPINFSMRSAAHQANQWTKSV